MIWLTWRQFRAQAVAGIAALGLVAVGLVVLGLRIRHAYDGDLAACRGHGGCASPLASLANSYGTPVDYLGYLLLAVPGLLGLFWGAPLAARELETGTHRLVWNQSVTRRRWLAAKLLVVGLAAMAVAGLYSVLLTWAAAPLDRLRGDRFTAPLFAARDIAPLGYAAFAVVLGTACGLLIRRTVPAMALTFAVFAAVQIVVPTMLRPAYEAPRHASVPLTAPVLTGLSLLGQYGNISGLKDPDGSWIVSTSSMLNAAGRPVGHTAAYAACLTDDTVPCLVRADLHVDVAVQPAGRFWPFQWYETGVFAGLAVLLAALCFWRVRGRLT